MLRLSRIIFRSKDGPIVAEPMPPAPEPGEAALPRQKIYRVETTGLYRTKRKAALLAMFGPGNG